MSVEQVQRWFGRRTTAKRVMQPLPNVAAPPAASLPEILEPDLEVVPPKQPAAQPPETKPRVCLRQQLATRECSPACPAC